MEFFQKLGALTGRLWAERAYEIREFPLAASRALAELPPHEHVTFWDVVRWAMLEDPLPSQQDLTAAFGQPPLTVYHWGREFHIELLFWVTGVPGVHRHSFSGAFHVLHGSSLHTEWRFAECRTWATGLIGGDLSLVGAELLTTGQSRPITSGQDFIHATFHLDRPSITVVIRTNLERDRLPQHVYVPPCFAYDDRLPDTIHRRLQLLTMLRASGRWREAADVLRHLFNSPDVQSVFHILSAAWLETNDADQRADLLATAGARHGALVEAMRPMLEQLDRRRRLMDLRATIDDPDLQFFLALLLNVDARGPMLEIVRQRHPTQDPLDLLTGWSTAVASRVYADEPADTIDQVVRSLVKGNAVGLAGAPGGLAAQGDAIDEKTARASRFGRTLRDSWLFKPLCPERVA